MLSPSKNEKILLFSCIFTLVIHVFSMYIKTSCYTETAAQLAKLILYFLAIYRIIQNLFDINSLEPLNIEDKKDFEFVHTVIKYILSSCISITIGGGNGVWYAS